MIGGHGMGGAYSHIKAFGLFPFHIKGNSVLKACWADDDDDRKTNRLLYSLHMLAG